MRNQAIPVMSDVDEDNFDRAFELIRPGTQHPVRCQFVINAVLYPVIQGTTETGKALTEGELQVSSLDIGCLPELLN